MAEGALRSKKNTVLAQAMKFGLVGVLNTLLSYAVYAVALTLGAHYLAASILGYVISVFHAWLWQYFVIFKDEEGRRKQAWWKSMLKTYASYALTGLVLSNALLFTMLDVIHIEDLFKGLYANGSFFIFLDAREFVKYAAPLFILIVTVPLNFVLNKYWAFKSRKADDI